MLVKIVALSVFGLALSPLLPAQIAGTWEGAFVSNGESVYAGLDLDETGGRITGAAFVRGWAYSTIPDGRVEGSQIWLAVNRKFSGNEPGTRIEFKGTVTDQAIDLTTGDSGSHLSLRRLESEIRGPLNFSAPAKDLEGSWRARFTGRIGDRPKAFGDAVFDFRVDNGGSLTGVAHLGSWPGDCLISDGEVEHGRISFTATGHLPSSGGIPVLHFVGEIHADGVKLAMKLGPRNADVPMDLNRQ